MSKTLKCPAEGCTATTRKPPSTGYNVGDFAKSTGWCPVFCDDGSLIWLCPVHGKEAKELGAKLIEICGSEYVVTTGLRGYHE